MHWSYVFLALTHKYNRLYLYNWDQSTGIGRNVCLPCYYDCSRASDTTLKNFNKLISQIYQLVSNLQYDLHWILKLKCFSSRLAIVFAQPIEARRSIQNQDIVEASPTGDGPTTSEWWTILLPPILY